ncbi:MAG TPA: hypothetical protein VF773_14595, partial [Verrucomicrobiae bacterium]
TSPNPADSASDSSHPSHASHPASPSQPTPDASPSFPSCPSVKPPNPFHSTLHHLPLEQRHQIIAWLQKHTNAQTIGLIQKNFGVTVGHSALGRFHASTAVLQHLEETPDTVAAADELLAHLAGHQHQFTDATLRVLEQTAFKLSLTAHHNVAHLDQLNRVSTILCRQRNASVRERQAHVQERKCDLRHQEITIKKDIADRTLALREKTLDFQREKLADLNSKLNTKNSKLALPPSHYLNEDARECDHLGPYASNREELSERARIHFGVPKEEWDRRLARNRELFEKLYDDDGNLKDPSVTAETLAAANSPGQPQPSADAISSTTAPNHISGGTTSGSPTSTSRDAINETTPNVARASSPAGYGTVSVPVRGDEPPAALADQSASALPSPSRGEGQGEGFRAHSNNAAAPADQNAQNNPPQKQPSAPTHHSSPITQDLKDRVDEYTIARMREHIAHNQKYTPWPHRHSPPVYVTQLRHCPCGHQCPCPIHESKEFGPFPDFFWKIAPTDPDYAAILEARNLPFRFPQEFIA